MKILSKTITWILIPVFLSQNIAWTALSTSPQSIVHSPQSIYIPEAYGKIEQKTEDRGQGTEKTVILIKDAHCHYEAQTNIAKILDILIRDYEIDLIGSEGAAGSVNPQVVLESNPKEELRKKVSDKFLRTGLLTASEALSINRGKDPGFTIWGVEDLKLYLKDYQAFRDSVEASSSGRRFIELVANLIEQIKNKIYPKELSEFDQLVKGYEQNKTPMTKFIKTLHYRYGIQKQYKNLKLILKSIKLEKGIDFNKVEKERADLIKELEKTLPKEDLKELVKQSLLFKLGKIPAVKYYEFLKDFNCRSNLKRYIKLTKLQDKINENELFNELEEITEAIYAGLCKDKICHDLHKLDKDINILNKILNLEATRDDLTYYKNNKTIFTPEKLLQFIKIQAPLYNIPLPHELNDASFLEKAEKAIIPADEFYKLAIERDTALVENLIQTMHKNKKEKAVLICGGFHADGINKILQDKGISVLTITPSITKIQEDSREIYLKRMMDERINPEEISGRLGIENLGPMLTTSDTGIELGLQGPVIQALGYTPSKSVSKEEFIEISKKLWKLYEGAIAQKNTSLAELIKCWARGIKGTLEKRKIPLPEGIKEILLPIIDDDAPDSERKNLHSPINIARNALKALIHKNGGKDLEDALANIYGYRTPLDDIEKIVLKYTTSGSKKDVYKITLETHEGEKRTLRFAAYKAAKDKFEPDELPNLERLRKTGYVPRFGMFFEMGEYKVYMEEWIDGHTAFELLKDRKDRKLDLFTKMAIIRLVMRISKALDGHSPIDLNLANFMYDKEERRMVMVDIGQTPIQTPASLLANILADYGPLPQQVLERGDLVSMIYLDEDYENADYNYVFRAIIDVLGEAEGKQFLTDVINDSTKIIHETIKEKIRDYLSEMEKSKTPATEENVRQTVFWKFGSHLKNLFVDFYHMLSHFVRYIMSKLGHLTTILNRRTALEAPGSKEITSAELQELLTNLKNKWQEFYLYYGLKKDNRDFCDRIRAELSGDMIEFLKACLKFSKQELDKEGIAPGEFCFVILGSLARGELPFTADIEFAIIPKDKDSKEYVERLTKRFLKTIEELHRGSLINTDPAAVRVRHIYRYIFDTILHSWLQEVCANGIGKLLDGSFQEEYTRNMVDRTAAEPPDAMIYYSNILNAVFVEVGVEGEREIFDSVIQSARDAPSKNDMLIQEIRDRLRNFAGWADEDHDIKELLRILQNILYLLQAEAGIFNSQDYSWLINELKSKGLISNEEAEKLSNFYRTLLDTRLKAQYKRLTDAKDTIPSLEQLRQDFIDFLKEFLQKRPAFSQAEEPSAEELGRCVTGDTVLPLLVVKRRSSSLVRVPTPIVDVKPGDYVFSLNEETQKIEPHRIKGLLDMGIKPVYRLTTASGRSIKTTANHPYLTRNSWVKVNGLKQWDEIAVPNVNALLWDAYGNRLTLEPQLELQKGQLSFPYLITSLFRMNEKSTNNKYYCQDIDKYPQNTWEFFKEVSSQSYASNYFAQISNSLSNKLLLIFRNFHPYKLWQRLSILSNIFLIIYSELEAAELAEGDILWDRIVSIEYIGYEHVYDIEVEGTHNFIGNGIFAHNTAIGERHEPPTALKAPDGDGEPHPLTDVEKKYIEEDVIAKTPPFLTMNITAEEGNARIHVLDLGKKLGIPRSTGATEARNLVFAYGKPGQDRADMVEIYVTKEFWNNHVADDPTMLAFLIDHEWQENIVLQNEEPGKRHRIASRRAWLFVDSNGMNPFYKFYINQLAKEGDFTTLGKLTAEHPNDVDANDVNGKFGDYAIEIFSNRALKRKGVRHPGSIMFFQDGKETKVRISLRRIRLGPSGTAIIPIEPLQKDVKRGKYPREELSEDLGRKDNAALRKYKKRAKKLANLSEEERYRKIIELVKQAFSKAHDPKTYKENSSEVDKIAEKYQNQELGLGYFIARKCGVCRHHAMLFDLLADAAKLRTGYIRGRLSYGRHAWNEIYVDRKLLVVDIYNGFEIDLGEDSGPGILRETQLFETRMIPANGVRVRFERQRADNFYNLIIRGMPDQEVQIDETLTARSTVIPDVLGKTYNIYFNQSEGEYELEESDIEGYLYEKIAGQKTDEVPSPSAERVSMEVRTAALKAPGSDPLDEDKGERKHIEELTQNNSEPLHGEDNLKKIREAIGEINKRGPPEGLSDSKVSFHLVTVPGHPKLLGIPRSDRSTSAKDLVYAYGENKNGQLHISVTEAFWKVLEEYPLMLPFLIDHEWQENIVLQDKDPKERHRIASQRAWLFVDSDGMNPFYRFYIDRLAKEGDIEALQKLTGKHENDREGKFRKYVQDTILGRRNIEEIQQFGDEIASYFGGQNPRILNITHTTDLSTGLTEVLNNFMEFGRDVGMNINEFVPRIGDVESLTRFFQIAVKMRHAIQGEREVEISSEEWAFFERINQRAFDDLKEKLKDTDIIVLHNHYYLALAPLIKEFNPEIKIIWQYHLEAGDTNPVVWNRLKGYIDHADLAILQPRRNSRDIYYRLDITPPAVSLPPAIINPTSEKHEHIDPEEVNNILGQNGIDPARPYFLYTGRYARERNIDGAIRAFVNARERLGEKNKPQLVIAGTAVNEEESAVHREISALKARYPGLSSDIIIITPEKINNHITNALQQGAFAGLQLAHREGFGLAVAEIMWKGKPVIGMNTGGIAMQIEDAQTGYLVDNVPDAANRMVSLLENPQLAQDMGVRGREYVYRNYLITQLIRNYGLAFLSVLDKPTHGWFKKTRAVNAESLHKQLWESTIIKTTQRLQEDLLDALRKGDTERALRIMKRLEIIHDFIWNNLTEYGTASVLVIEKLKDILFEKLRQEETEEQIDLACITLPIAGINKLSYEKANQFKKIFFQRLEDRIREKRGRFYAAYEQLNGKYYGFAKTRLYVIGLGQEELQDIVVEEIFPQCLREIGIRDISDFHIYVGHMRVSLTKDITDTFRDENVTGTLTQTSRLVDKLIMDSIKEITGRAEVAEKVVNRPTFGEDDIKKLDSEGADTREKIKRGLEQGRLKYIPENEYTDEAYIPRLSHMLNNLNRLWQKLYNELRNQPSFTTRGLQEYLYVLNEYFLYSFRDNRYKRAHKKEAFNAILSAQQEDISRYIKWLGDNAEYIPKVKDILSLWNQPLRITKMGDEIWFYMALEDGGIIQNFADLDKLNAFNEDYPPDIKDSFYHQILDAIFGLHNNESRFTPSDVEKFAGEIGPHLQNLLITIPDGEPYSRPDGYMPMTSPAVVQWQGEEKTIVESTNLLENGIKTGERHALKSLKCHYSEKVKINGEIYRPKLYKARNKQTGETRRFVVFNRRLYTADGKGEEDENDITDKIMQDLANLELSPVKNPINITFTTDFHNLLALDPSRISDLNTYQKKHMDKKVADVSEIIAHQIISILEKHGITGISAEDIAKAIIKAKEGKINIDFMQLWGLIKGRIEPEKFFEIAASISKPLNTLLGPEAKNNGAQMLNAILKEIVEKLPEKERKEILTREKLTDEERLIEAIKKAAAQKGIDPDAIQSIFDLFKGGLDILTLDPELDMGEIDGAYFDLIKELELLTGISQGSILNAFKRAYGVDVKITQAREIADSPLQREARRLEKYNEGSSGEKMALSDVDKKLWDMLFTAGYDSNEKVMLKAMLKTPEGAKTRNQFLSAMDAVKKDVNKIVNLLKGGPVELKEETGVVLPIDMLIELSGDGTFSYKPGIEGILENLSLKDKKITIAVMIEEGDTRYDRILSVMDKRVKIIRGGVDKAPAELGIPSDRIAFLFKDKADFSAGTKSIFVEEETPLHTAILLGVIYARIDVFDEKGELTSRAKEVLSDFLKRIGNMKDDEIRMTLEELNSQGYLTLKLVRITKTLEEFQNRKIFIEVAA